MSTLPIEVEKQIARKCLYSGCDDGALEDSDFCAPHEAHERGRDAGKKRRRRLKLAKAGLCITGCGRRVSKKMRRARKGRGARIKMLRCSACTKAHKQQMVERRAKKRGVPDGAGGVPGEAVSDESDPQWRVDPGTNWMRFRGKGRRGRLTREDQAQEDKRDARFAMEYIAKFVDAVDVVMSDGVQELGPIQRKEARRQAAQHLGSARRMIEDLEERYVAE